MNMKKMLAVVAAASLVAVAAPALAANPFSDVPMNHWAYDAVEELASKGILEGYPNGTFKGNRAMTRYEIASMVARMMNADLDGADLEKLKALIVEFQPELEALGVKVDSFDARLSALEKGMGGWRITGQMRFDYRAYDEPTDEGGNGDNGFQMNRGRLFLHRDLPQGVSFDARWHSDSFDRFWVTAKDFMGVDGLTLKAGQFNLNWESDDGLYIDNDSWLMDLQYRGFGLQYDNGAFLVEGFVASNAVTGGTSVYTSNTGNEYYGARMKYRFSDKGFIGLNAIWTNDDDSVTNSDGDSTDGTNYASYWVSLGYNILDGLELKGAYYVQDIEDDTAAVTASGEDSPNAFKIILDIDQSVLKFTSLWAEYANIDAGFILEQDPYGYDDKVWPNDLKNYQKLTAEDTDILFLYAKQQWNSKWSTFLRYTNYDGDTDDATEWGGGIGYQYSPNLYFELGYMDMDGRFEDGAIDSDYDNQLIRFRTLFNF